MTIFKRLKNIKQSLDAIKKFWRANEKKKIEKKSIKIRAYLT